MIVGIVEPEFVIENEIAQKVPQKSVAKTYRMAMESERNGICKPDWHRINRAILGRWKQSGLERIKKLAWSGKCFAD